MKNRLMILVLAGCVLAAGVATAAVTSAGEFLAQVQQRVDAGQITPAEALLLKFEYAFDRAKLPEDLQPVGLAPMKCATDLLVEFQQVKAQLPADIRAAIEPYTKPPQDSPLLALYQSPSGHFILAYDTSGVNAPPQADLDGSGYPDYVEHAADYLDFSWQRECDEMGFAAPPGTMTIHFADQAYYGVTYPAGGGMTTITLENDFVGFPPNDDPDGDVLGAMKVTCAHEFKHSTQYAGSNWSEGGWVELDATWMEDIVYDATNDYYNYLPFGSGIASPASPLDDGGTGSYDDCIWQHCMSETYGWQLISDLWFYRRTHQGQPMLTTYDVMLQTVGTSLTAFYPTYTGWNFATGARSSAGFGYGEAADYPSSGVNRQFNSYPSSYTNTVAHLAANNIRCLGLSGHPGQNLQVTFNGTDTVRGRLAVYTHQAAGNAGPHNYYDVPLDGNSDAVFVVPDDLASMYEIGIIVTNPFTAGTFNYSVQVAIVDGATPVSDGVTPAFVISGNHPNPFNPATRIDFSVAQPGQVNLDVYDLRGQRVRSLVAETMAAGAHSVQWDGLSDAGQAVASGTYIARMSSGGQVTTHKLVLAK